MKINLIMKGYEGSEYKDDIPFMMREGEHRDSDIREHKVLHQEIQQPK